MATIRLGWTASGRKDSNETVRRGDDGRGERLLFAARLDAGLLAGQLAQVVEPGLTHDAGRHHFDLVDERAVGREDTLDADAEADLADGERAARAGELAADHDALEHLHALLLAFHDLVVHFDRVADANRGQVLAELCAFEAACCLPWK